MPSALPTWPDERVVLPLIRGLDARWMLAATGSVAVWGKTAVRFLAQHTGLPALLVAAILVAVGWRLLKRAARIAVEIAVVTAALVAATELGWIRW